MQYVKNDIIKENRERLKTINAPYNPITGEGSTSVERIKVEIKDCPIPVMFLPKTFVETPFIQSLIKLGFNGFITNELKQGVTEQVRNIIWEIFIKERIKHDFEFWAILFIIISAKGKGSDIKFKLNRAQRRFLMSLESLRIANKPIDIILCKARQWGGSTLTQLYMLWIQLVHRKNWNSVICGDVEGQSRIVSGMISKALKEYPTYLTDGVKVTTLPFEGSAKTRIINTTQCIYSLGSAQKPDSLRSQDISMAHFTEVGLWKKTKGKKPEDIVQSIFGSILVGPYSLRVLESTAKGVGNYFHRQWVAAINGKSNFTPVFIPWFMIDNYSTKISDYYEFIDTMEEYDWELWELGATLEAINWYKRASKDMEPWRMCSEFPSTAVEAFQSSGRRAFRMNYVRQTEKTCIDPWFYGEVEGNADSGKGALEGLKFKPLAHTEDKNENCLWVWIMPDIEEKYRDRYVVIVDVGGVSEQADFSDILVYDRYPMLEIGGLPEIVAEWHGHIEHDRLAWKAAQISEAYGHALLVIESNTLETEGTEGDNFEYILNEIAEFYDNLYCRTSEQQIRQGVPARWGFHTNTSTKPMVVKHQVKSMRDGLYIERCKPAINEFDVYEIKEDGKSFGAVDGMHDDRVITRCIGGWICYNIPLPVKLDLSNSYSKKNRIVSEASF